MSDEGSRIGITIDLAEEDKAVVLSFPGKKKPEVDEGPYLKQVLYKPGCQHRHGFIINDKLMEVECSACHEKLNPMWALIQLANMETRWHQHHEQYQQEVARLRERQRTKCRHCGEMTPISRS
ncbi:hypothetical protein DFLDMN_001537 [Cupriavidus sp. H19C3]|uniref:hypothetical protein n=1 Tax=Cupriavidus sp. H19C3 TaxID=3241603 RepID=UPI003BF8BC50